MGSVVAGGNRQAPPEQPGSPEDDEDDEEEEEEELEEEDGSYSGSARSLATRMFRAASNAFWRTETAEEAASNEQLATFFVERAKYIPLRLEMRERKYLRLLEGTLHVSEYTDRVDSRATSANPAKRKQMMMRELHSVLSGLLLSCDYEAGQAALQDRSYSEYPDFFAPLFEVTRRYKVMSPSHSHYSAAPTPLLA